jgi:hypothetical protein
MTSRQNDVCSGLSAVWSWTIAAAGPIVPHRTPTAVASR